MGNLSGPFAQLLRYTAPADTRSTIVRLRSAETASLAFETKFHTQNGRGQKNGAVNGEDILDRFGLTGFCFWV